MVHEAITKLLNFPLISGIQKNTCLNDKMSVAAAEIHPQHFFFHSFQVERCCLKPTVLGHQGLGPMDGEPTGSSLSPSGPGQIPSPQSAHPQLSCGLRVATMAAPGRRAFVSRENGTRLQRALAFAGQMLTQPQEPWLLAPRVP